MKFSGKVGFWIKDQEIKPGVFKPGIIEKSYTGDVLKNIRRFQSVENQQNDNLITNNRISIIGNLFMQENWPSIKYVSWKGVNWTVKSVDVSSPPRIILELGGVYNERKNSST